MKNRLLTKGYHEAVLDDYHVCRTTPVIGWIIYKKSGAVAECQTQQEPFDLPQRLLNRFCASTDTTVSDFG